MVKAMKKKVRDWLTKLYAPMRQLQERQIVLNAQVLALRNRELEQLNDLGDVEFSAFSQWGEDGVIDWLISRVPDIPLSFVEFGVENYRESNTRLLLLLRNWRGLVLDGSSDHVLDIRRQDIYWRYGITAACAFIDRDNINQLLEQGGLAGPLGLLSVDIDGNDYWVWKSIEAVDPAIVVTEYNAVLGDLHPITIPYSADFDRTEAHHSNLYFGASLPALIHLGKAKGYTFVGTTTTGCNAFFLRDDLAHHATGLLSGVWAYPSQVREARDSAGRLLFIGGAERARPICHLPVVHVETGEQTNLAELGELYSDAWRAGLRTHVGPSPQSMT